MNYRFLLQYEQPIIIKVYSILQVRLDSFKTLNVGLFFFSIFHFTFIDEKQNFKRKQRGGLNPRSSRNGAFLLTRSSWGNDKSIGNRDRVPEYELWDMTAIRTSGDKPAGYLYRVSAWDWWLQELEPARVSSCHVRELIPPI